MAQTPRRLSSDRCAWIAAPVLVTVLCTAVPGQAQLCSADHECTGEDACIAGRCVPPVPDPAAYADQTGQRQASYWRTIQLPALFEPAEECCFDYTGDGTPDDGWGNLLALTASMGTADPQGAMDLAVQEGRLVKLVDWRALPAGLADGEVQLSVFDGRWEAGLTYPDMQPGTGSAYLELASFGSHGALDQFNTATLAGGVVTGTGSSIRMDIDSGNGLQMDLDLQDPRVELPLAGSPGPCAGVCTVDETRPGSVPELVGGGRVGGLILVEQYMSELDAAFRTCGCAGIDPGQPVFTWAPDPGLGRYDISCTDNTGTPGSCSNFCTSLTQLCMYFGLLAVTADVDTLGDGVKDAWSVGLRVGLSGVEVAGLSEVFADGFESGDPSAWDGSSGGP
jgi:hypothetical protein